jgi:hypothetical protein
METRAGWAPGALLWLWLAPAFLFAATPDSWIPARWDGGPVEAFRRSGDKALSDPGVREAIANWYSPVTLSLLEGSPVNCLLLTLSAGAGPEVEKQQRQLVKEYTRRARERGLAVLGLVYPGADPPAVAAAAADAQLDGLVLEGEFPGGPKFAERLERTLRSGNSKALVIPVATPELHRKSAWPVLALEGVLPGVGKLTDAATASATGGLWIDSNMWLVRSFRRSTTGRPVWITQRARTDSPGEYLKSIADAAAAGGRWVVALDDDLRSRLFRRDAGALAVWRSIGAALAFFKDRAEWQSFTPFGNVGIVLDATGPNLAHAEECLNLVARRQIPYRVIERSRVGAGALAGLRAVLAFDLAPPTEGERKSLNAFAEAGGLVLSGPSWGSPPKDQSYAVLSAGQGEVAVYKDAAPDPESVARDLNDLVPTPELGVGVLNAPSVLSYVSVSETGDRMLIQLVNYAGQPAESLTVWVTRVFGTARLHVPGSPPAELRARRRGSRTEIVLPKLPVYGALLLE